MWEAIRLARDIKAAGPKKFTQHMVPHVVRPAQIIWNKALCAIFLFLCFAFFYSAWSYSKAHTSSPNPAGIALSSFMGLVMAFFGVASWLRVRRLSRL